MEQCYGGKRKYGGITDLGELKANLQEHCLATEMFGPLAGQYDEFLELRRNLMAAKIKGYFDRL